MRMSRRAGLLAAGGTPTLADLIDNMTVYYAIGHNADYSTTVGISVEHFPTAQTAYLFSIFNGYVGIWKYNGSAIVSTPIKQQNASYGGVFASSYGGTLYNAFYYSGGYITSGSATWVYGATMALVQFPDFEDAVVDSLLSNITLSRLAGRNSSSAATTRTSNQTHAFILAAFNDKLEIRNGSTWSLISGTTNRAARINGTYLELGTAITNTYGGSIIGID